MMATSVVMKLQAPKSNRLQLGVGSFTHSTIYSHQLHDQWLFGHHKSHE